MDIEKLLQETTYDEPLISGMFQLNGNITELTIYSDSLSFSSYKLQYANHIHLHFRFIYDIIADDNDSNKLVLYCPTKLEFLSQRKLDQWDDILIKVMKIKDFMNSLKELKKQEKVTLREYISLSKLSVCQNKFIYANELYIMMKITSSYSLIYYYITIILQNVIIIIQFQAQVTAMKQSNRDQIRKLLNLDSMINQYLAEPSRKLKKNKDYRNNYGKNNLIAKDKTQMFRVGPKYKTVQENTQLTNRRACSSMNFNKIQKNTIEYGTNSMRTINKKGVQEIKRSEKSLQYSNKNKSIIKQASEQKIKPCIDKKKTHMYMSTGMIKSTIPNSKQPQQARENMKYHETLPNRSSNWLRKTRPLVKNQPRQKLLKSRYSLEKIIGRGLSGVVYKAKDILSERYVAIKIVDEKNQLQYEFIKKLSHHNMIQYYNCFEENGSRYLVLEFLPLTLTQVVKRNRLTDESVQKIFKQIANGVLYLHSMSYAHRDIKLDNIVASEDLQRIKFIDFGLCIDVSLINEKEIKRFCGTTSYMSPEIIQGKCLDPKKADIWALGIVLYMLVFGRPPFKSSQQIEVYNKIKNNKIVLPTKMNQSIRALLVKILIKDPEKRPSIFQVINHQWNFT